MDEAYDSPPVFQTGAADGLLCSQDDLYGSRVRVKRERCILPPVLSVYSDASAERPGMLPHVGVFIISVQGLTDHRPGRRCSTQVVCACLEDPYASEAHQSWVAQSM